MKRMKTNIALTLASSSLFSYRRITSWARFTSGTIFSVSKLSFWIRTYSDLPSLSCCSWIALALSSSSFLRIFICSTFCFSSSSCFLFSSSYSSFILISICSICFFTSLLTSSCGGSKAVWFIVWTSTGYLSSSDSSWILRLGWFYNERSNSISCVM